MAQDGRLIDIEIPEDYEIETDIPEGFEIVSEEREKPFSGSGGGFEEPYPINDTITNVLRGSGHTVKNISRVYPALETAATLVTSAYGIPLSGFAGLAALPFGADVSTKVIEKAQQLMIYQPQAKHSQELAEATFYPFEKLGEAAHAAGEKVYEKTDSALAASLVEGGIMAAPAALPFLKSARARALTPKQVTDTTRRIKNIKKNNPKITDEQLSKVIEDIVNESEKNYWLKDIDETTLENIQQKIDRRNTILNEDIIALEKEVAELKSRMPKDPFEGSPISDLVRSSEKRLSEIKTKLDRNPADPTIDFDLNLMEVEAMKMARIAEGKEPLESIFPVKAQESIVAAETIKMKIKALEEQNAPKAVINPLYTELSNFQKRANTEMTKFFKKEEVRKTKITNKLWYESGKGSKRKPPVFKSSMDVDAWTKKATAEDIPMLEQAMEYHYSKARAFRKAGKHDDAVAETTQGGFYREAVENIQHDVDFKKVFKQPPGEKAVIVNKLEDIYKGKAKPLEFIDESKLDPETRIAVRRHEKNLRDYLDRRKDKIDLTLAQEENFVRASGEPLTWWDKTKSKTKEIATTFKNKISREYEHLPHTDKFAPIRNELLRLEKQRDITLEKTFQRIKYMTEDVIKSPKDYEAFVKKVVLDDLYDDVIKKAKKDPKLPFKYENLAELKKDYVNISDYAGVSEEVSNALFKRKMMWDDLKNNYIDAMNDIGYDVGNKFSRPNYYRHIILDYAESEGIRIGTGKKLKAPTRRPYMWRRKGSLKDYSTDFATVESEVIAKMSHDIEIAKVIKFIEDNYDIKADIIANTKFPLGSDAELAWRDHVPDGYTTWQPREGNIFHVVDAISGKVAEELMAGTFENLGIQPKHIRKVLAKEGRFKELVIPEELAKTLDNITRDKKSGIYKKSIKVWKKDQLMNPKRLFKYNFRNLTGDADAVFAGNPKAFFKARRASVELWNYYAKGKLTEDLAAWIDRGGTQTSLQAQEMGALNRLNHYIIKNKLKFEEGKVIKTGKKARDAFNWYWRKARMGTDLRESVLRYANYLEYMEQMKKDPTGRPKNFGASRRQEIMALPKMEDRAFWLSNDLLGAYDKVSVTGQFLRENLIPFWSWKEVNMKRYGRLIANAAEDGYLTSTLMKKVPGMSYKMAKFLIKASGMWAMMSLWNNLKYGDLEAQLPDHVRRTPHLIIGKGANGEVNYINRLGAVGDALEWFGLDTPSAWINDYFHRGKGIKEIAKKTFTEIPEKAFKNTINNFVNGLNPVVKIAGESITRRSLFPDAFSPRTIRDRLEHLTSLDPLAQDVYNYIYLPPLLTKRKPAPFRSDKYETKARSIMQYMKSWGTSSMDIEAAAYSEALGLKRKFMKDIGKSAEGFWLTESGKALYSAKLAYRYKDSSEFERWMKIYFERGGTVKGLKRSIKRMHPLGGMTKEQQKEFYYSLNDKEREVIIKAMVFYDDLSRGYQPKVEAELPEGDFEIEE